MAIVKTVVKEGDSLANVPIRRAEKIEKLYPGSEPTNKAFVMIGSDVDGAVVLGVYCEKPLPKYYSKTIPEITDYSSMVVGKLFDRDTVAPKKD